MISQNKHCLKMDVAQIGCVGAFNALNLLLVDDSERKERRWGTHPVLQNRLSVGQFHTMFVKHRQYPDKFFQYYRMSVSSFDELLSVIGDKIQKKDTVMKKSIHPAERLVITLRYLASGCNFGDLEFDFHVSRKTIPHIIKETCNVIWQELQRTEMPEPTSEEWLKKSQQFEETTNFPNCIGAVDGKHVRIQCPPNSGSQYYNYKKYHSLVLLAVSDANFFFTAVDIGAYGREGDSSIFKNSNLGKRLLSDKLCVPKDRPLPLSDSRTVPFILVADEAFGLSRQVMRPYPSKNLSKEKKVYNYRHSRARRTVECSFGILSNKWRVLHSCIMVDAEFATTIIQSCCILHNFVRRRDGYVFEDILSCDMNDYNEVVVVGGKSNGIEVRDVFKGYFNGPGAVPWQTSRI